ncbi:hypothetical protein Clacol_000637 [Clathrus columnatus]|uniref:DUF1279 domain-containing protein n=1 Tax=Clathrus columnatus TaxID=1419009 RepID=A0AAV5A3H0_9AGAM|nr:hypothetical protein Clacol_000637 [Clathrus columnatus]
MLRSFRLFTRSAVSRPLLPIARVTRSPQRITSSPSVSPSRLRLLSSPSSPSPPRPDASRESTTLSNRLKTLIKSYGWYALGVYVVLSSLDFAVAFVAINLLGAEYVAHAAATAKSFVLHLIGRPSPDKTDSPDTTNSGSEGLYAMLVLAYTVHKTLFLPVRIGLTAAVTPRFVNWLSRRGWTGTDGARRAGQEIRDRVRRNSRDSNASD